MAFLKRQSVSSIRVKSLQLIRSLSSIASLATNFLTVEVASVYANQTANGAARTLSVNVSFYMIFEANRLA